MTTYTNADKPAVFAQNQNISYLGNDFKLEDVANSVRTLLTTGQVQTIAKLDGEDDVIMQDENVGTSAQCLRMHVVKKYFNDGDKVSYIWVFSLQSLLAQRGSNKRVFLKPVDDYSFSISLPNKGYNLSGHAVTDTIYDLLEII